MYVLAKNEGKFEVKEVATDLVMYTSTTHKDAHKVYRKFSGGMGFNGWTPDFFFCDDFKFNPEKANG